MLDRPDAATAAALARLYDLDLTDDPGDLDLYLALADRAEARSSSWPSGPGAWRSRSPRPATSSPASISTRRCSTGPGDARPAQPAPIA